MIQHSSSGVALTVVQNAVLMNESHVVQEFLTAPVHVLLDLLYGMGMNE